jgi:hypothetical protein
MQNAQALIVAMTIVIYTSNPNLRLSKCQGPNLVGTLPRGITSFTLSCIWESKYAHNYSASADSGFFLDVSGAAEEEVEEASSSNNKEEGSVYAKKRRSRVQIMTVQQAEEEEVGISQSDLNLA